MANVYDDQANKDSNNRTDINPGEASQTAKTAQPGTKQDLADRENLYNPAGDSTNDATSSSNSNSADSLGAAEQGAASSGGGLYNSQKDAGPNLLQKLQGGKAKLLKHKALLGLGGASGVMTVIIIITVIVMLGSLKLPNVMSHIVGYEFARMSRQFAERASATTDEAFALEAADTGALASLKAKYTSGVSNVRDSTWGKLDKYRPSQVIENMGESNGLKMNYKKTALGRKVLTSSELDGVLYEIKPVTGAPRFVPGLRTLIKFKNTADWAGQFRPALNTAIDANKVAPIIRGASARYLRKVGNINLIAWHLDKFRNTKTPAEAIVAETGEVAAAADRAVTVPDNARTSQVRQGVADANAAETGVLADPAKIAAANASDGIPIDVENAITKSTASTLGLDALGVINPIYAIAVPICIIFDGSVQQSGPAITNQTNQQQASFYHYASGADQQKVGNQTVADATPLSMAVGATNTRLGDIAQSNPEILARGGTIDTSSAVTAEAGASGSYDYSIFNALGIPADSAIGKTVNSIVQNGCGVLTDLRVAVGVGIANIVATIFLGGSPEVGEQTAGQAARVVIAKYVENIFTKDIFKNIATNIANGVVRASINRGLRFGAKQLVVVGAIYGATELANLVVANRAAQVSTGFAAQTDAVNIAQSGANIHAGELERRQLFGRPLRSNEVSQSDHHDQVYIASLNQSKSFSNRYFASSNVDSLVSHVAMSLNGATHANTFTSLLHMSSILLKPLSYGSTLLGMSGVAHAAPDPSTQHYGNVQFGWSEAEEQLRQSNASYTPLENQRILDDSGQEAAIATKYAYCFGYSYSTSGNGNYDPTDAAGNLQNDPTSTIGTLLADKKIDRDSVGNVTDSAALCSPNNLSAENSEFGVQMVYRWRLAMSYITTLSQLTNAQDVQA